MNRKLKVFAMAAVACLAMSALAVASSQAAEFHSKNLGGTATTNTTLSAGQTTKHEFTAGAGFGGITCEVAKFEGTQAASDTPTTTIHPTYEKCKDTLGRTAVVTTTGANYTFHAGPPGTVDVVGANITINIGSGACVVTVLKQTGINGISYTNNGNKVKVTANSTNVVNETTGGLFNCGIGNGKHTAGTYTGTSEVSGSMTSEEAKLSVS